MSEGLSVRALLKGREVKSKAIQRDLLVIGRDPECDLRLDNTAVSRHHARIERRGASYVLRDLGSANGTYVNGMAISLWPIRPGDTARVAKFDLVFESGAAEPKDDTEIVEFVPGLDDQNTIQVGDQGSGRYSARD